MSSPAIGFYAIARLVQYPLPGMEDFAPAIFMCTNNIEVIIRGRCVGWVLP